jgi:hypothetical protein
MSGFDRQDPKFAPPFDIDPVTGLSIEVFYADRTFETFGKGGPGWFWHERRSGSAPDGPANGALAYRKCIELSRCKGRAAQR